MSTQSEAFQYAKDTFVGTQQKQVLEVIAGATTGLSRADVTRQLGMRHSSVTARINELIKLGSIYVADSAKDPETGRRVELLAVSRPLTVCE